MNRREILHAAGVFAGALTSTFVSARAQSGDSADWDKVVDAAKKEGRVVIYSNAAPALNTRLKAGFEQTYPGIAAEFVRIIGAESFTKLEQERVSGSDGGDFVLNSDFVGILALGKLAEPKAPAGPSAIDWPAKYLLAPYAPIIGLEPIIMVYNTGLYKKELSTYPALLDPELKGKIAVQDLSAVAGVIAWYDWIEQTQGEDFLPKLAAQSKQLANALANTQSVASGEAWVAPVTNFAIAQPLIALGAPIRTVVPNPALGAAYAVMVPGWARRPNAGLLLLDYMTSVKGQTAMVGQSEMGSPRNNIVGSLNVDALRPFDYTKYTPEFMRAYTVKWNKIFRK